MKEKKQRKIMGLIISFCYDNYDNAPNYLGE